MSQHCSHGRPDQFARPTRLDIPSGRFHRNQTRPAPPKSNDDQRDGVETVPSNWVIPAIVTPAIASRVWTARRENDHPLLVVVADDSHAPQALLGPLPHYGAKS